MNELLRTSLISGIGVSARTISLLVINKVLAFYVGPSGLATVSQFQNGLQILFTLGGLGIKTGVTKYTAEFDDNKINQIKLWKTCFALSFLSSIIVSLSVFFINFQYLERLFGDETNKIYVQIASLTIILNVFNNLLIAILNGKKEIVKLLVINLLTTGISFATMVPSIIYFGINGAICALIAQQTVPLFATGFIFVRCNWLRLYNLFGGIDPNVAKKLFHFSAMSITSAICFPLAYTFIRNTLSTEISLDYAGYWDGLQRLSSAYTLIIVSTLSVYYLPKMSSIRDHKNIKLEIWKVYKLVVPMMLSIVLLIYSFREDLIIFLFSEDFLIMTNYIGIQLIGDLIKIFSWVLGYVLTARAFYKTHIISEVIFTLNYSVGSFVLIPMYGLSGALLAYCASYFIHIVFLYVNLRKLRVL